MDVSFEPKQLTTLLLGSVLTLGVVFLVGVGFGKRLSAKTLHEVVEGEGATGDALRLEPPELTFHDALTSRKAVADSEEKEREAPTKSLEKEPMKAPAEKVAEVEPEKAAEAEPEKAMPEAATASAAASESSPTVEEDEADAAYTVQVASSKHLEDTRRLADRLEEEGYAARIVTADIPGKGRWYRIRVGRYEDAQEAAMEQAAIKVAMDLSGIVVRD